MQILPRVVAVSFLALAFAGCQPPQSFVGSYVASGTITWRVQTSDGMQTADYEPPRDIRIAKSTTGDIELRMDGCALPFFVEEQDPESAALAEQSRCNYSAGAGVISEVYTDAAIRFTDEGRVSFTGKGLIVDGYDGTQYGTFTVDVSLIRN